MLAYFNCNTIPVTQLLFSNCITRKIPGYYGLKGTKESSFVFGFCSLKPTHVSYLTCRKNRRPNILFFFFTKTGPSFNLSNGQAAFSMPLVYSFYCKEFVVSLFHQDFSPLGGVCLLKILCQAKFRVG